MLDRLAPARRRFVLGIGALLVIALVAVLGLTVVHRDPGVTPVAQDAQPPVLLVPGYGGSTSELGALVAALRADGRTARIVELGHSSTGDLHDQADVLDRAVRDVLDDTGAHSVDLVGYSAGGVTVRVWLADHRGGGVARRVVTLGSPHHGTAVAGLAADVAPDSCPTACQQLAPDSDLLRELNAHDETPAGPLWVSIWTEDDKTVVPPTSGRLTGAVAFSVQSVCPGDELSHAALPSDPAVVATVLLELGRAAPAVPTSAVCAV
jgi:triacylglycerol esterase/lipase EstA (alpha/beta hydrolase family)